MALKIGYDSNYNHNKSSLSDGDLEAIAWYSPFSDLQINALNFERGPRGPVGQVYVGHFDEDYNPS